MANIRDFVVPRGGEDVRVPELPSFSEFIGQRGLMEGMRGLDARLKEWRQILERQLRERIAALSAAEQTVQATVNQIVQTQAASQAVSVTPAQLAALENTLSDLQSLLTAHIAATAAHGTASAIVGVSDEQALNAKIIGQTAPRVGIFSHVMTSNSVNAGENLVIDGGRNMIVAGPFTVNGTMMVNGYFASVFPTL